MSRPRGLGWKCYYTPGVKELYPSTSKYARRGVGNFAGLPLPAVPTAALPGSPEKILVMEQRAAAGQAIFHPMDAVYDQVEGLPADDLQPFDPFDYEAA